MFLLYFYCPKFFNIILTIFILSLIIFFFSIPIKNSNYQNNKENAKTEKVLITNENNNETDNETDGENILDNDDKLNDNESGNNFAGEKIIYKGKDCNLLKLISYKIYFYEQRDSINCFDGNKNDFVVRLYFTVFPQKHSRINMFLPVLQVEDTKYYKSDIDGLYSTEITYLENKEILYYPDSKQANSFEMVYVLPRGTTEFDIVINEEKFCTIAIPSELLNKTYTDYTFSYCRKECLLNDNGANDGWTELSYQSEEFSNFSKYEYKTIYKILSYEENEEFKYAPQIFWDNVSEESKVAFSELAPVDYRY